MREHWARLCLFLCCCASAWVIGPESHKNHIGHHCTDGDVSWRHARKWAHFLPGAAGNREGLNFEANSNCPLPCGGPLLLASFAVADDADIWENSPYPSYFRLYDIYYISHLNLEHESWPHVGSIYCLVGPYVILMYCLAGTHVLFRLYYEGRGQRSFVTMALIRYSYQDVKFELRHVLFSLPMNTMQWNCALR